MAAPRVLICEDSRSYAVALRRMLEYGGELSVVAVCASAEEALAGIPRYQPDLITMDVELPGMDGLRAVEEVMSSRPVPILVLSSHVGPHSDKAAAALAAGALDALAKGDIDLSDPGGAEGAAFRRRVAMLSHARVIKHPRRALRSGSGASGEGWAASVVGVCSSTGGPQVLARLIEQLPADYAIPILVVQHISIGFTEGMARWLDQLGPLPVRIPRDGALAEAGVWIAPEGHHLRLTDTGRLALDGPAAASRHRPSGDVLLRSIADAAGSRAVAVVLSGMGVDGAAGAMAVRLRGGHVIAQDRASSAVYGMPKAVADAGADQVLPPAGIAAFLLRLVHQPLPRRRRG